MTELIGLLPAAGRGSRLGPIPCSKEIMPLGFQPNPASAEGRWQPVTAIETHLQALKVAGATQATIVISETKSDIVRYIGDGSRYGIPVVYLYQQELRGMPFALNLVTPWIGTGTTIFSMPDTLITPVDTLAQVVIHHQQQPSDLTLGLFYTTTPHKFGMIKLDTHGRVITFVDKPVETDLNLMWGLAAWSRRFTKFLDHFLASFSTYASECVLSDVFLAALHNGLSVQAIILEDARYHDIGTPEDFQTVVREIALCQTSPLT